MKHLPSQHAKTGSYATPYRFNAKLKRSRNPERSNSGEQDPEPSAASSRTPLRNNLSSEQTGNYCYGARYGIYPERQSRFGNPQTSIWFGVDAMADQRTNLTPYSFVSNNPIMRTDPDGNLDGDYYDKNWNWLGNDRIDDGAVYQVEGESRFDINQFKERGKYYNNHNDFSKDNGDGYSVSFKGQANDLFGEGVDPLTVQVTYSGEWIQKPAAELVSATPGESRFKIRGNPGGKVGVGYTETDYFITGEISAEILVKRYVNGSLVESKSVCYNLSVTKKVIVGLGVTWGPIKYYNTGKSILKAPGKIIDGIQYYNYFMNALEQIGESKIIPNEVAKNSF